jgi:hypothetical protein
MSQRYLFGRRPAFLELPPMRRYCVIRCPGPRWRRRLKLLSLKQARYALEQACATTLENKHADRAFMRLDPS